MVSCANNSRPAAPVASGTHILRRAQVALRPRRLLQGREDATAVEEDGTEPGDFWVETR